MARPDGPEFGTNDAPTRSVAPGAHAAPWPAPGPTGPAADLPRKIGRYTVRRLLGEGGMGAVYEAEQESPQRTVALKVIRTGLITPEMLRRFEQETRILGRLQHPGIAQIYEAGTLDDGSGPARPFFAMELIRGVRVNEFADKLDLGTRDRLKLIAKICDAINHAHQKGVIHRDLKPGNILIDKSGQPKVLDFGVARATDGDVQTATLRTDIGQLVGTVPYMSPEQVSGDPDDLDTRSDIYSLGVIAYELLAGRLPYDVHRKVILEAARIIREAEPSRLSSVNRSLRGDVETIVAKALEKDKARRYPSAEALAADIRRYLRDEPITARPASAWYQMAKFSRRNTGLVAGMAAAALLLVAGMAGVSLALTRALAAEADLADQLAETKAARDAEAEERARAKTAERAAIEARDEARSAQRAEAEQRSLATAAEQAAIKARDEAQAAQRAEAEERTAAAEQRDRALRAEADANRRAADLQEVARFQGQMLKRINLRKAGEILSAEVLSRFERARPSRGSFAEQWRALNTTDIARTFVDLVILSPAVETLDRRFQNNPVVDATIRQSLADKYADIAMYDRAQPLQDRALRTNREVLGESHPRTRESYRAMGDLLVAQGRHAEAAPYYEAVLERRPVYARHAEARLLAIEGDLAAAERKLRAEISDLRKHQKREIAMLRMIDRLGSVLSAQGRFEEAEACFREALAGLRSRRGDTSPDLMLFSSHLGAVLLQQGKAAEAEPVCREAVEEARAVHGESHPSTLEAKINLGAALHAVGRHADAVSLLASAEEASRVAFTDTKSPMLASLLVALGSARAAVGEFAAAEASLLEGYRLLSGTVGEASADARECALAIADMYKSWHASRPFQGHLGKAKPWQAKAVAGVDDVATNPELGER